MTERPGSPVYGYLRRPSMVDFRGRLAAVFFVSGCNFRCRFCHNAALVTRRPHSIAWSELETLCDRLQSDWVNAAVITGGEPTLCPGLKDLIGFFRERNWAVKLDTNGSQPEIVRECCDLVDYVAMDVKAGPSGYADLTGFAETDRILESIGIIRQAAADYEFRTTVLEAVHTDEQMREIADMIAGARRYVLNPFVPREGLFDPACERMPRTNSARMRELATLVTDSAEQVIVEGS